jgi:hypothetical protein
MHTRVDDGSCWHVVRAALGVERAAAITGAFAVPPMGAAAFGAMPGAMPGVGAGFAAGPQLPPGAC